MRIVTMAAAVAASLVAGCATVPASYVSVDGPSDANAAAYAIVQFVAQQMPPGSQRCAVYGAGHTDTMVQPIVAGLMRQGIVIAHGKDSRADGVHQLHYWVDPLDQGELVRIWLDGKMATQLLTRGAGGYLRPSGPFTIREAQT